MLVDWTNAEHSYIHCRCGMVALVARGSDMWDERMCHTCRGKK